MTVSFVEKPLIGRTRDNSPPSAVNQLGQTVQCSPGTPGHDSVVSSSADAFDFADPPFSDSTSWVSRSPVLNPFAIGERG